MSHNNSFKQNAKNLEFLNLHAYEDLLIKQLSRSSEICNSLDSINGVIAYKTLEHELIYANKKTLHYTGHKKLKDIIGKKDSDLIWQDYSSIYYQQEIDALNGNIYSALHPGTDVTGRNFLFFNRKYPWRDEQNNLIGIICHSLEINNSSLIELCNLLKKISIDNPSGIHFINKKCSHPKITAREHECLFYTTRGKSAKSIGRILGISNRTVEKHIDNLKNKLKCTNKAELINAASTIDLLDTIPASLIGSELAKSLKQ